MPKSSIMGWVQVGPDRVRRGQVRNTRNMRYKAILEIGVQGVSISF
jgi:hypothetical protein